MRIDSKEFNEKKWQTKWAKQIKRFNKGFYKERAIFLQNWIKEINPKNILEIASGGYIMAKLTQKEIPYTWTEISETAMNLAKKKIKDVRFLDCNDIDEDFIKQHDLVICFGLDHIEKDLEMLRKIKVPKIISVKHHKTKNHYRSFNSSEEVINRYKEFKVLKSHTMMNKNINKPNATLLYLK